MRYISLIIMLSLNVSYAEMAILKKGDVAPFDGIIVDAGQMKEFRKLNDDNKSLELENLKLKDLSVINDQRIDLYKEHVKQVTEDLSRSDRRRFWSNIGMFALGVVVTGFAAKVAIEASR